MKERLTKLRRIANDVSRAIQHVPSVVAIAAYGSLAEGTVDSFSDINLVAICSKIPEPETRRRVIEKAYDWIIFKNDAVPKWRTAAQDFFFVKGENVDVTYKTYRYFNRVADEMKADKRVGRDMFKEVMTYVYNTRILHDPRGVVKRIRSKLPKATPQLLRYFLPDVNRISLKAGWPYDALQQAVKDKNYLYISSIIDTQVENLIISLYVLNGKHYTSPKWAISSIRNFKIKPKSTTKRLQEIARLGNDPAQVKRKINLLQSLVSDLNRIILEKRVFDILK